ncbi:MAG TPA: HAD-IA family hydrolase [Gaiellaceae bacterium]|nr:HAD-IA family hydrolase [Gaiellaceae bacterium]
MTAGQRLAEIDAVTVDAFGTLLELPDPIGSLARLLPGVDRDTIAHAFRAETSFYIPRSHQGRDPETLASLRAESTRVFNDAAGSSLTPEQYIGALEFAFIDGTLDALERLRARGLSLCVVSNWDIGLHDWLAGLGVPVVTSADAGAPKPDPAPFRRALELLATRPERTLHVGDGESDRAGAAAMGMRFAPAPLAEAVGAWT